MKRSKKIAIFFSSVLVFLFASCKSTPKEEVTPVEEVIVEEIEVTEPEVEVEEISVDLSLLDKVNKSREAALAAGADSLYSQLFTQADELLEKIKVDGSNDQDSLKKLDSLYKALELLSQASKLKNKIDDNDFSSYDLTSYDEGCEILDQVSVLDSIDGIDLTKSAQKAFDDFTKVLDVAFKSLCKEERMAAFNEKKNADSVKAYISKKAEYDNGVKKFQSGDSKYVTKDIEGAYFEYKGSKEIFSQLYTQISAARAKAQSAVDSAKQRVAESEQTAVQADIAAPLALEEAAGFEDEDAKLLEEDDFSSNDNSEVELAEDLDEE